MSQRNWDTCGTMQALLLRAADLRKRGHNVMACLVVQRRGSAPQMPGAMMFVQESGETFGTIGGGPVEAGITSRAIALLATGGSELRTVTLNAESDDPDGSVCGGSMVVAVAPLPDARQVADACRSIEERREAALHLDVDTETGPVRVTRLIPPRDRLYIAGAGHVGKALARLTVDLDFETIVVDDREESLDNQMPTNAKGVCGHPANYLAEAAFDDRTFCVIVTRGHKHDEQVLEAIIDRPCAYLGMIGSRRKIRTIFDALESKGKTRAAMEKVHAPIGLAIGAVAVAEIAISIAAELIQVRQSAQPQLVVGPGQIGRRDH